MSGKRLYLEKIVSRDWKKNNTKRDHIGIGSHKNGTSGQIEKEIDYIRSKIVILSNHYLFSYDKAADIFNR